MRDKSLSNMLNHELNYKLNRRSISDALPSQTHSQQLQLQLDSLSLNHAAKPEFTYMPQLNRADTTLMIQVHGGFKSS